jgi:hypothetical protein
MKEDRVLTIINKHIKECGEPPNLFTSPNCYIGYFENQHGEQLVYQYNRDTKQGRLWHGDCRWAKIIEVVDGYPLSMGKIVTLSEEELAWLYIVCKMARSAKLSKKFMKEIQKNG